MRIVALVKQIPAFDAMQLGADGRLVRSGLPLEMNAYCRRAVATAVDVAVRRRAHVTFVTLGPETAADCLLEALAWARRHGVLDADAVHLCDRAFAGSDTLATARTLAAAITMLGGADLIVCGRNSVDADTGQVGPQLAELLDVAFVGAARALELSDDGTLDARSELDDGAAELTTRLPAVVACAERLCEPCKVPADERDPHDATRIRTVRADDLGAGPWGVAASPTWVGTTRPVQVDRRRAVEPTLPVEAQVEHAVTLLRARGALDPRTHEAPAPLRDLVRTAPSPGRALAVICEPDRATASAELLAAAARLAAADEPVVAVVATRRDEPPNSVDTEALGAAGADRVVVLDGVVDEDDVAAALGPWAAATRPTVLLAPSTTWGREVASRVAAHLGVGLTGDAVELDRDGVALTAWKPAFGGSVLVAIHSRSSVQMATVRPGVLAAGHRNGPLPAVETIAADPRRRVVVRDRSRDDDVDDLAHASVVVAVGRGVAHDDFAALTPLCDRLGARLAATRKLTDNGWMPRARQLGITGRSIAPHLLISIGANGKFNHSVGFRNAGTVLAINPDPDAPIFDHADAGIVAPWQTALPLLLAALGPNATA